LALYSSAMAHEPLPKYVFFWCICLVLWVANLSRHNFTSNKCYKTGCNTFLVTWCQLTYLGRLLQGCSATLICHQVDQLLKVTKLAGEAPTQTLNSTQKCHVAITIPAIMKLDRTSMSCCMMHSVGSLLKCLQNKQVKHEVFNVRPNRLLTTKAVMDRQGQNTYTGRLQTRHRIRSNERAHKTGRQHLTGTGSLLKSPDTLQALPFCPLDPTLQITLGSGAPSARYSRLPL